MIDLAKHWDFVYGTKDTNKVSWYQNSPDTSRKLIEKYVIDHDSPIMDVGTGSSNLPSCLIQDGYTDISVIEISQLAVKSSMNNLGERTNKVKWHIMNILDFEAEYEYMVWHDRAVFHFLKTNEEQERYKEILYKYLKESGYAIFATFSKNDGPKKCSGLDVCQHDNQSISDLFAPEFIVVESFEEMHATPSGKNQKFYWNIIKKGKL